MLLSGALDIKKKLSHNEIWNHICMQFFNKMNFVASSDNQYSD